MLDMDSVAARPAVSFPDWTPSLLPDKPVFPILLCEGDCKHYKRINLSKQNEQVCPSGAGVWATLQFKWVQMQYPVVVVAFEKLLLGGCLPMAATVQAWGVIAALGLAAAPFYLAPLLGVLYYLFGLPLPSSFAAASRKKSIGQLCMCPPAALASPACVTFACNSFACVRCACDSFECVSFACACATFCMCICHLGKCKLFM